MFPAPIARPTKLRWRPTIVALYAGLVFASVLVVVAPGGARELFSPLVPLIALAIFCARKAYPRPQKAC